MLSGMVARARSLWRGIRSRDAVEADMAAGGRFGDVEWHAGDLAPDRHAVIVNESFVKLVLRNRNPIGRHLRYVKLEGEDQVRPEAERGPWYEIVGVVRDLGMAPSEPYDPKYAGFYHPTDPARGYPVRLAVHVTGEPAAFASRLRR